VREEGPSVACGEGSGRLGVILFELDGVALRPDALPLLLLECLLLPQSGGGGDPKQAGSWSPRDL